MESTTPFRDPLPGALARRRELLSNRRDDFVEMPEAIRRTYVARWGRIGGGVAAALVASVFLALTVLQQIVPPLGSWLYGLAEELLPGRRPAVLVTLFVGAWLAGGFAWILARACAERAFARLTTEAALPSDDVNRDIERLAHVTPASIGQKHALRIEGASVGLPMLALALLLPPTAVYLALAASVWGYPKEAAFETSLLASSTGLAALAAVGLILALALRVGLRRWTTSYLRYAAGAVVAVGVVAGFATLFLGAGVIAVGLASLVGSGAGALLIVRRERVALGLGDSSAAALDDSIGRSLGVVIGIVQAYGARFVGAVASSRPVSTLRRLAARPRSLVRMGSVLLAAAGFAAGAVAFSLRAPEPEKVPWPTGPADAVDVAPSMALPPGQVVSSPGASLGPAMGVVGGDLMMLFQFDRHPAEARWRALAVPAAGRNGGWRVTVEANLVESPGGHNPPPIGLSPFRDVEVQFGRSWRFTTDCVSQPLIEWRAVAAEGSTSRPDGVRIAWRATLEACTTGG